MDAGATRLSAAGRAERPALTSFLGVFSATLLCFLAIGAVLPILPRYVTEELGAGDVAVGVVVGAFAITALVGRPIGGRLADRRGRKYGPHRRAWRSASSPGCCCSCRSASPA